MYVFNCLIWPKLSMTRTCRPHEAKSNWTQKHISFVSTAIVSLFSVARQFTHISAARRHDKDTRINGFYQPDALFEESILSNSSLYSISTWQRVITFYYCGFLGTTFSLRWTRHSKLVLTQSNPTNWEEHRNRWSDVKDITPRTIWLSTSLQTLRVFNTFLRVHAGVCEQHQYNRFI